MRNCCLLAICLFILNGCSGSPPATDEAKPSSKTETNQVATTEESAVDKKPDPKKVVKKDDKPKIVDPADMSTLEEAEKAFADGRFRDAATITENSLTELRSDGAPRSEIIKRMEYLATCQIEAKSYEKACATYTELAKAQPDNETYSKALKATAQVYWDQALRPKLDEANRLLDRKRFSSAQALAYEVQTAALKVHLDPGPANKVLASIAKAQAGNQANGRSKGELAVAPTSPINVVAPRPKPKRPMKVARAKTSVEADSGYPTSGQKRR